jgi:hypothetical protein
MAGDWIKIESALPNKPEVMQLATILGIDEMAVVGHLTLFWSWVDQNLSGHCPVAIGTLSGLDRRAGREGFAQAMIDVGWLHFDAGKISIPNYEDHLSQSAKQRALDAKRKRAARTKTGQCPDPNRTFAGTEKRREDKINPPLPPKGAVGGDFSNQWKLIRELCRCHGDGDRDGILRTLAAMDSWTRALVDGIGIHQVVSDVESGGSGARVLRLDFEKKWKAAQ